MDMCLIVFSFICVCIVYPWFGFAWCEEIMYRVTGRWGLGTALFVPLIALAAYVYPPLAYTLLGMILICAAWIGFAYAVMWRNRHFHRGRYVQPIRRSR